MLANNPFEQLRCHAVVPETFRIHNNDRPLLADSKTGALTTLDPVRPEEQTVLS
ncbi:MAG: hypothetical protein M3220_07085 [Chloroflexota bacterium]|nr:hypothetical protein [Chloroflexota bacterium]